MGGDKAGYLLAPPKANAMFELRADGRSDGISSDKVL